MTPTTLKKNQEIDILKREHIERNYMIQKFEGLDEVLRFMLKQNTNLDENDTEEMMARALANESSVVVPCSFAASHVPDNDDDDEVYIGTI